MESHSPYRPTETTDATLLWADRKLKLIPYRSGNGPPPLKVAISLKSHAKRQLYLFPSPAHMYQQELRKKKKRRVACQVGRWPFGVGFDVCNPCVESAQPRMIRIGDARYVIKISRPSNHGIGTKMHRILPSDPPCLSSACATWLINSNTHTPPPLFSLAWRGREPTSYMTP